MVTIHNNKAYNFALECPMEKRERATLLMKKALEKFIFLESGSDELFTYVSPTGRKYGIEMSAGLVPSKEFLEEVMGRASDHENSFSDDIIPAVINSFIQGMVLPLSEGPEAVLKFLHSSLGWDRVFGGLLEATESNFPISPNLKKSDAVRTARYVPSVIYAALLFRLIYRKRKKAKADQRLQKSET